MRILRVVRSLNSSLGGVAEGILRMTPVLEEYGIKSTLATLDMPGDLSLCDVVDFVPLGPCFGKYGFSLSFTRRLAALAKCNDIVIIEGLWQFHSFATWRALRGTGIPYVVYPHGMLDPWFKRTYPLKHLKKWAYWPWADYRVLRDATAVLFTTEQERLLARQSFWLYEAKEVVVGYGTSAPPADAKGQRAAFLDRFPHLRGQRILLFLSRIHPKKGVDLLIEAFAAVASTDPRLRLMIAGPDQVGWQAQLQQRAASLGIADRITWPGMLSGDLKWGAFRCAELFCLPSHQENFGIVVAEALACGLPVAIAEPVNIATDVAQAGAGIVHADTAAATTAALQQSLATTPAARAEMGARGRKLFAERFDFASVAKNLIPVLETGVKESSVR
jgi:glycosyltransferase involved in cell wall biosynthesis